MQPCSKEMKNRKPQKRSYMKSQRQATKMSTNADMIRLNRVIANAGICSRREADDLIKAGLVSINGEVCTEMGKKVSASDIVKYAGETIKREQYRYILANKPKNYVMGVPKTRSQLNIFDLIKGACKESVAPVGKLDKDTTGLVLFTNDQDIAFKLNKSRNKTTFKVECTEEIPFGLIKEMETNPSSTSLPKVSETFFPDKTNRKIIMISLNTNRPQSVKKLFEHYNIKIKNIDRISLGGITKGDLNRGKWRFLTDKEIGFLKMLA